MRNLYEDNRLWRTRVTNYGNTKFRPRSSPVKITKPMKRKHHSKTEGYTWLEYSFTAFNGSGYADRKSPEAFVESYIAYNRWKKRSKGVELAQMYYQPLLTLAEYLIENSSGGDRIPSEEKMIQFKQSKLDI